MGQSRISMQLAQLKQAGLVEVRRAGQKSFYRAVRTHELVGEVLREGEKEIPSSVQDDRALQLVLRKRKDKLREYFDELAGRFGRDYVPGRSWKGVAEMVLRLMPPLRIADLGAGEGTLALLLAQGAERVIAVDHSLKMAEYARDLAQRNGVHNLDYRVGDLEDLPLEDGEVDLAMFHQSLHHAVHPEAAIAEAWRVLRPGGRVAVLDLVRHGFEQAREIYADMWLGFSQVEVEDLLTQAGFQDLNVAVVHREQEAPHFETLLAIGRKPCSASERVSNR